MVLLRYFFAVFLLMSVLQADRDVGLDDINVYTDNPRVELLFGDDGNPNTEDYIGIYNADEDAIWDNVIQWNWVSAMQDIEDNKKRWNYDLSSLSYGVEYKVAYFVDNNLSDPIRKSGRFSRPNNNQQEKLSVQAEDANPSNGLSISSDGDVTYISTNTTDYDGIGSAKFNFTVTQEGEYKLQGRYFLVTNDAGKHNSFFIQVDDTPEIVWGIKSSNTSQWLETDVTQNNDNREVFTFQLTKGEHTVTVRGRESLARLDWLELIKVGDANPDNQQEKLSVQAEDANPSNGLSISSDGDVDYISTNTTDYDGIGNAEFNFYVTQEGDYKLKGRHIAIDGDRDSFFVKMDDGTEYIWDLHHSNTWQINNVTGRDNNGDDLVFHLTQGEHTVTIRGREKETKLDWLELFKVGDANPDNGDDENNLLNINYSKVDDDGADAVVIKDNSNNLLMYATPDSFIEVDGENFSIIYNEKFANEAVKGITPTAHGFDIDFTLKNKTNEDQNLTFSIEIPGISFNSGNNLNVLNTLTYMVPQTLDFDKYKIRNINPIYNHETDGENDVHDEDGNLIFIEDHLSYPVGYSPVIVAHDGTFAVGASMLTSYNEEKIALKQFVEHNANNTWSLIFKSANGGEGQNNVGVNEYAAKILESNQSETFKLRVRFADVSQNPKNWIYTLAPYKNFFNNRFPNKHIVQRDTRPILGINFAFDGHDAGDFNDPDIYTTRGYTWYLDFIVAGKNHDNEASSYLEYASILKQQMNNKGYKRVLFWEVGGSYFYDNEADNAINLPSQFMSNIPKKAKYILDDIVTRFNRSDDDGNPIDEYGFWWGRSGQVPVSYNDDNDNVPDDYSDDVQNYYRWNANEITSFDILNSDHRDFSMYEYELALDRGSKVIGLDAFANMKIDSQFPWIKELKKKAKDRNQEVKFMTEGTMSDYLHTELSIFLQPNVKWFNRSQKSDFSEPPLLADYLNPNAEIIVWLNGEKNQENLRELMGYGFTPLPEVMYGNIKEKIPSIN